MPDIKPITIKIEKGKISITYATFYKKQENGMYSWFIPGFNMRFSSDSIESGNNRSDVMITAFMTHWSKHTFKEFIIEINRLGFKAQNHNSTMVKLLRREIDSAKFKSSVPFPDPKEYKGRFFNTELKMPAA